MNDLKTVIYTHSVAPHHPGCLCVSSSLSALLYEDWSKDPPQAHMLDCTGSQPKSLDGKNVIGTQQNSIPDMCLLDEGDKQLLVAVGGGSGMYAYNTVTDELEWRLEGELEGMEHGMCAGGVTTDGRGHLFTCDVNNKCIQMVSVRDGTYVAAVMRERDALGIPCAIQWCETGSSIVVTNYKNDKGFINVINVK